MSEPHRTHPLASVTGLFALLVWSFYALYAAFSYPASLTSVRVGACFGLIACLAVIFNFAYWRAAVLLASFVYLLLYVIRVVRMTAIANHLSFFSGLSFYYSTSWRVTAGSFEEKLCWAACSMPIWNSSCPCWTSPSSWLSSYPRATSAAFRHRLTQRRYRGFEQ